MIIVTYSEARQHLSKVLNTAKMGKLKDNARKIIEKLPEEATIDDLMYELYVNEKIQNGLDAIDNAEIVSHEEVKKRFSQ